MEFSEFASRILFGDSLDEKLVDAEVLTDRKRVVPLMGAVFPGRPSGMALSLEQRGQRAQVRQKFPSMDSLENERARGSVLHFFANHELLALELMALMLLRFPDAPASFRRGLVQTIRDEQRHFKLYLGHMRTLGVEFGSQPLNGFFWKLLGSIDRPMDFVTSMSMTFEQANLDFAISYRKVFEQVGDSVAASIMDAVLEDEIRHVRHGFEWFRRWKDPALSDWEAYLVGIKYPVTPARARGFDFHRDVRYRCGFDDEFILSLETSARTKGRPPRVFFYNPGQEFELGTPGLAYTNSRLIEDIALDLEFLMAWFCSPGDALSLRAMPSAEFLKSCLPVLSSPPEIVLFDSSSRRVQWQRGRKVEGLKPWGWSEQTFKISERLLSDAGGSSVSSGENSRPNKGSLRFAAKHLLPQLRREFFGTQVIGMSMTPDPTLNWESLPSHGPLNDAFVTDCWGLACVVVDSIESIYRWVNLFSAHCREFVVIKAPFGSSGHNQLRVRPGSLSTHESLWIKKALSTFGKLVIEPWRDVIAEFSIQASCEGNGSCQISGIVRNLSSGNGQYVASAFGRNLWGLSDELNRFISNRQFFNWMNSCAEWTASKLAVSGYRGPFGIDCYVYRRQSGDLEMCLLGEINLRFTMGRVALELGRRCRAGKSGILALVSSESVDRVEAILGAQNEGAGQLEMSGSFSGGFVRLAPKRSGARVVPVLWLGSSKSAELTYRLLCNHS